MQEAKRKRPPWYVTLLIGLVIFLLVFWDRNWQFNEFTVRMVKKDNWHKSARYIEPYHHSGNSGDVIGLMVYEDIADLYGECRIINPDSKMTWLGCTEIFDKESHYCVVHTVESINTKLFGVARCYVKIKF